MSTTNEPAEHTTSTRERLEAASSRASTVPAPSQHPASTDASPTSTYTVLRRKSPASIDWELLDAIEARTAADAIRQAVHKRHQAGDPADGTYAAVPFRSWKPTEIQTTTRTILDVKGV